MGAPASGLVGLPDRGDAGREAGPLSVPVRHFLRDDDLTPAEQDEILRLAASMKADRYRWKPLAGPRSVALLLDKASLRTRVSFAVGIAELGGNPLVLDMASTHQSRGESIGDTARVLSRQVAAVAWRTFGQDRLEEFALRVVSVNELADTGAESAGGPARRGEARLAGAASTIRRCLSPR